MDVISYIRSHYKWTEMWVTKVTLDISSMKQSCTNVCKKESERVGESQCQPPESPEKSLRSVLGEPVADVTVYVVNGVQ